MLNQKSNVFFLFVTFFLLPFFLKNQMKWGEIFANDNNDAKECFGGENRLNKE